MRPTEKIKFQDNFQDNYDWNSPFLYPDYSTD